eukprot:TRINITY_DN334_c2_g1_i1.p1 TRINITY_DN334_c2_g1~~TRINITY_DN334_c2_g1_i1.p1  ORF type:complete len:236 (+),score=75.34 TRINITY_DN334_c2_g1_i1:109-816(+)
MAAFVDNLKKMPLAVLLKYSCILMGGLFLIFGAITLFLNLLGILSLSTSPSKIIIGFYLVIGGFMIIIGEFQIKFFTKRITFFKNYIGRGVFLFFVSSLTYATNDFGNVIPIILMVLGGIGMILGIVEAIYYFFAPKQNNQDQFFSETEMQDPNFDPNIYSDLEDPKVPGDTVADAYDPVKAASDYFDDDDYINDNTDNFNDSNNMQYADQSVSYTNDNMMSGNNGSGSGSYGAL